MDNDELMRLRGEQVTLEKDRTLVRSQLQDEKRLLHGFVNGLHSHERLKSGWIEIQIARLRRIESLIGQDSELAGKIKNLKLVSGI